MSTTFAQQLQAQPWFQSVSAVFAKAGVPAPLWESTIETEDKSLDPNAVNYGTASAPENSHGLFQINIYGDPDPVKLSAALGDPATQAQWAATQMATALQKLPAGADLPTQLRAIENAGWPGNLSQDTQRQAALADVTGASNGNAWNPLTPGFWKNLNPADPQAWLGGYTAGGQPQTDWPQLLTTFSFGALGLALLAGAFAIFAGGTSAAAANPKVVPVPV